VQSGFLSPAPYHTTKIQIAFRVPKPQDVTERVSAGVERRLALVHEDQLERIDERRP
jgi:hypothetical protein